MRSWKCSYEGKYWRETPSNGNQLKMYLGRWHKSHHLCYDCVTWLYIFSTAHQHFISQINVQWTVVDTEMNLSNDCFMQNNSNTISWQRRLSSCNLNLNLKTMILGTKFIFKIWSLCQCEPKKILTMQGKSMFWYTTYA